MRRIVCLVIFGLVAQMGGSAVADHLNWYVRGAYNGWAGIADPMVNVSGPHYTKTLSVLATGVGEEFKVTLDDWSVTGPGSNAKVWENVGGAINLHFWETDTWADGWEPSAKVRLGYDDPGTFDWEIAGAMNGWNGGDLLTDQGGGLHTGTIALAAGTYDWKFRQQGSWDFTIGDDFGNAANNNSITVANNGDVWAFELDLPNGRWRAFQTIPEPSSFALAGLALAGMAICVARRRG